MFITFEGPDGSGKTTQFRRTAAALQAAGYDVIATREPGGTLISNQIRDVLLNRPDNAALIPQAEALLFSAARAQHVAELIRPALAAGQIVICDRFADSTLAYQGYGYGLDLAALRAITAFATGSLTPDLTLFLDCPPEEGLRRRAAGQVEWNRLDDRALDFHRRTYEGYRALIAAEPGRWIVIDACPEPDAVFAQIAAALRGRGLRVP
jgi:dTMP kinase